MTTGSPESTFISNRTIHSQNKLEEESNTRLSSPNLNNIIIAKPNSRVSPSPPPIRRNSTISHQPPSTTSIIPPLLSHPPPRQRFNLPQFPPPPIFDHETLQPQPNLQIQQILTTKIKSRVDKSSDEDSTILKEEIRKSKDDMMKNKNRSPAARKEVNENIPQINILKSL